MIALEESLVTVPPTAPLILQEDWSQDEKSEENTEKIHKYSLLLTDSVPALHKFT